MAGSSLTIKLTDEQQSQIKSATGKSISELKIALSPSGEISQNELVQVSGGADVSSPPLFNKEGL